MNRATAVGRRVLIIALYLFLHVSVAEACTCVSARTSEKQRIATAYRQEALIFVGRVLHVDTVATTDTVQVADRGPVEQRIRLIRREQLRYTFAVSRQFKGPQDSSTVQLYTETQSSMCGKQFTIGSEHLVYAYQVSLKASPYGGPPVPVPPYFATSICDRNQPISRVKRGELRYLARLAQAK
jgi:hypothetical protein